MITVKIFPCHSISLDNIWFPYSWFFRQENERMKRPGNRLLEVQFGITKRKYNCRLPRHTPSPFSSQIWWACGLRVRLFTAPHLLESFSFCWVSFPSDQEAEPPQYATGVLLELVSAKKPLTYISEEKKKISFQLKKISQLSAWFITQLHKCQCHTRKRDCSSPSWGCLNLPRSHTIHAHFQIRLSLVKNAYKFSSDCLLLTV